MFGMLSLFYSREEVIHVDVEYYAFFLAHALPFLGMQLKDEFDVFTDLNLSQKVCVHILAYVEVR